ncbi:hypothetical protein JAAARDRAFT_194182 [Jaapia argillacea MUCL 33604]|uniref:WD40 repeat-like protein n=1 Tax=Jaapia argillacea MUCL 33604 TaxID=933084 RepID=A0A067PQA1_9AGAM|nr:hypothetical protein JAAARDRAFT_194182 [Jaapia argillacea MUCL 33604]
MTLAEKWSTRFSDLSERLSTFQEDEDLREEDDGDQHNFILAIFKDACELVWEAEIAKDPQFDEVLLQAKDLINEAINYCYSDSDVFEFIPSFAHSDDYDSPLVEDTAKEGVFSHAMASTLMPLMRLLLEHRPADGAREPPKIYLPQPWNDSMKPHPNTTPLARFREDFPPLTASSSTPLANIIYQARCQVSCDDICTPIRFAMASSGSCLVLNAAGGWKNRAPMVSYFLLDDEKTGFPTQRNIKVGLADIAYNIAVDESRKLIWAGDSNRIKSWAWGPPDAGEKNYKRALATHTLDSDRFSGPMVILPSGNIVRAGEGAAKVWNIGELDTHGPDGKGSIGAGEIDLENSWRDDPDEIEPSIGNQSSSELQFTNAPDMKPFLWRQIVGNPGTVLSSSDAQSSDDYSVVTLNLGEGGKVESTYIGHGAGVADFSVSDGDPRMFLTGCDDGFARLFDLRRPLPVMTFDVGGRSEGCPAVVFVHPDGIPTVFSGCEEKEQIKVWDVRARTIVYELATGNNSVSALAWDSERSSLYAATECQYMDRMGNHYDYRRAKIPKASDDVPTEESTPIELNFGEDGDDDDEDEDDYDDDERCWPKRAWHAENYFGHTFDAGEHRIYRYAFKGDADTTVLPYYGGAYIGGSGW